MELVDDGAEEAVRHICRVQEEGPLAEGRRGD